MRALALPVATAGTGLVAGLFLAFATAVMPGLRASSDPAFVHAMQRINVVIVNPLFLLIFLGSPLVLVLATVLGPERRWVAVALALHVVALGVSFAVNIPHNDALAAAGSNDPTAARAAFEHTWNVANQARTVLMVASCGACLVALTRTTSSA